MDGRSTIASTEMVCSKLYIGKIDLTKTLTPEEKFEIITRNLQVCYTP